MIMAAINPTMPASPKDCTKLIMFPAISPTNGTFPPNRLTAIPNASNETTTFVKLSNIEVNPEIAFMFSPLFINKNRNEYDSFRITYFYHLWSHLAAKKAYVDSKWFNLSIFSNFMRAL